MQDTRADSIDQIIQDNIDHMVAEADGDDAALVRLAAAEVGYSKTYAERVEEIRDAAAARLRDAGVPMTYIAGLAKVSDSYLARRLFERGAARKVRRMTGMTLAALTQQRRGA